MIALLGKGSGGGREKLGIVGTQAIDLLIKVDGVVEPFLFYEHRGQVSHGVEVAGVQPQCLAQQAFRGGVIAFLNRDQTQVGQRRGLSRVTAAVYVKSVSVEDQRGPARR